MENERRTQSNPDQESQRDEANRRASADAENTTGENAMGSGSASTNNDDLKEVSDD